MITIHNKQQNTVLLLIVCHFTSAMCVCARDQQIKSLWLIYDFVPIFVVCTQHETACSSSLAHLHYSHPFTRLIFIFAAIFELLLSFFSSVRYISLLLSLFVCVCAFLIFGSAITLNCLLSLSLSRIIFTHITPFRYEKNTFMCVVIFFFWRICLGCNYVSFPFKVLLNRSDMILTRMFRHYTVLRQKDPWTNLYATTHYEWQYRELVQ